MYIFLRDGYYYFHLGDEEIWGTEVKTKSFCPRMCVSRDRINGSWLHTAPPSGHRGNYLTRFCQYIKISFKIFQVRSFNPQFWWGIMLFFLPELFWLSAVAGTHSRRWAGLFKRYMISLCLLKIRDISLEVGTVVHVYKHIFRGSARGIMFLAVALQRVGHLHITSHFYS